MTSPAALDCALERRGDQVRRGRIDGSLASHFLRRDLLDGQAGIRLDEAQDLSLDIRQLDRHGTALYGGIAGKIPGYAAITWKKPR